MAGQTDSELESTLAGDQGTSLSLSTAADTTSSSRLNATRQELEKWQLQHTIQLLKLELSQKNIIMETVKSDHAHQLEELRETLSEVQCERKLLQQRLKALTHVYEEEKQDLKRQLDEALKSREILYTQSPPSVVEDEEMIRDRLEIALQQTLPTEIVYEDLIKRDVTTLAYTELVQIRLYEVARPFINEGVWLKGEVERLSLQVNAKEKELADINKKLENQKSDMTQLELLCNQLSEEKTRLNLEIKGNNFKSEHYNTIKHERDTFERELETLRRVLMEKEMNEKMSTEGKDKLQSELTSAQHSISLLKQDKNYLHKQVTDYTQRCREYEGKLEHVQNMLADVKQSKEQLYEQFVRQKQEQKNDYESRLQQELDSLRLKTNVEIDQLRVLTREMHERENRALQQARDSAYDDRERALGKQRELEEKYEQVLNEYRQLQVSSDGSISELQSELQMKVFEFERTQLLHDELCKKLKKSEKDRQELREKIELLSSKHESTMRDQKSLIKELETKLSDRTQRLETYEQLEHELDDIIMQAANVEDEKDAERVLFSYGFGTSIPSSTRHRIQQSVQLARRVLKLERINSSLRQQLEAENKDKQELKEKIVTLSSQVELANQPHKYLMESLRSRDQQLQTTQNRNSILEAKLKELEQSHLKLKQEKNLMTADLERLLSQQEELSIMKDIVKSVGRSGRGCPSMEWDTSWQKGNSTVDQPQPTIFTRQDPPSWYSKLKQRADTHKRICHPKH